MTCLEIDDASARAPSLTISGVCASRDLLHAASTLRERLPSASTCGQRRRGALADLASPMLTPLMRVCAEKCTNEPPRGQVALASPEALLASTTMLRPSGVSSASEASCAASAAPLH